MNAPHRMPRPANTVAGTAARLIANGYRLTPVEGKAAFMRDWSNRPASVSDFKPRHNVGILTGEGIALVDIDVTDPDASAAITAEWQRRHPGALQRTGKAPKTAFLVRSDLQKKIDLKVPALGKDEKGNDQKIEVLSKGQQFVAFGIHPDTGKPYHWHGDDPLTIAKDALPVAVSEAELRDFVQWVRERYAPETPLSERAAPIRPATVSGDFWSAVKAEALASADAWVPALFPKAKQHGTGAWRVTSRDLGRDLEEDISIHPGGIEDFGEEVKHTAIDLVRIWAGLPDAKAAAFWLCDRIGLDPAALGWRGNLADLFKGVPDDLPAGCVPVDAPGDPRDMSQDALSVELGRRKFDADARYVSPWNSWLLWDGTRWQLDKRLHHLTMVRQFCRDRARELTAWAAKSGDEKVAKWAAKEAQTLRHKTTVTAVESLARSNPASAAGPEDFDAHLLTLGTPDGTVDLRTGEMRAARRSDMISKQTLCGPASGRPERWLQFLHEIFDGDQEMIAFVQRAAGYALTGKTTEHKLFFCYGTGRNGKSVFLNTLMQLWGDYARRSAASTFLHSKGDKHPTDVAGLQGARLVAGSELPKGKTWDEAVIKDLTGGDKMSARYMRGDFFDFDPQLSLFIYGNNQPSFRGVDEAIRARVVLIPFTVYFPPERRDKHLQEKLLTEGPQILAWAIEGARQWLERGLEVPASVSAASTEYLDDEDIIGQFLADETADDPDGFATTSSLHQRFRQWCDTQGLHNSGTVRTLQKEIASRGYRDARRNYGRGFIGLSLNPIPNTMTNPMPRP